MSTRTNIVVKSGKSITYLYRHSDGYLAETGADILTKIVAAKGEPDRVNSIGIASEFLRSLLAESYDATSFRPARPVYELTNGLHGDIEHVYYVTFDENRNPANVVYIRHAARPKHWESFEDVPNWARNAQTYTVDGFRDLVNADRAASNKRIAVLRASSKHYADCEDYAMV